MQARTFDSTVIDKIVPNKTTKDDVISLLGNPEMVMAIDKNTEMWSYVKSGMTTGNRVEDSIRKNPLFGYTSIKNDMSHLDTIMITIKKNVVVDVKRNTMARNWDNR